ncbi:MAG: DUF11 domain-containing protein [Chiayiivirga sp.]|jgi:hypothetical protein|uniref:DUF7507 domain-containing protein n=1 Tax=Chiayiivirga sp. TaxID=2041042 RepID=UPI0025BC5271|nr:hypothetical protein [Chiayiivirga sp.]MCI1710228.1 DUF11 domain-containing protein [Chiayiivirga sp.]MCI1728978.1 DUF11 domain-containing protein [Chiayiivirga sp.]
MSCGLPTAVRGQLRIGLFLGASMLAAAAQAQTVFRSGFEQGEVAAARFVLRVDASIGNANANGVDGDAGDTLAYVFTAQNTGLVELGDVVVDAQIPGPPTVDLSCTVPGPVAPNTSASCSAPLYIITSADTQSGRVRLTARATANGTNAPPVDRAWDVVVAASDTVDSGLGINLESVVDFAVAYPFADFFKQSRPWITSSQTVFDTGQAEQLDLDADGWVQSLPACNGGNPNQFCLARTVFNSAGSPWPGGPYVVCYEGSGSVTYSAGASFVSTSTTPACPRRDVINVDGDGIWFLTIESTGPAPNHIRNIRVLPPGIADANTPRFHPDFLAELAPYRSIRFMDWAHANGDGFNFPFRANPVVDVDDLAELSQAHWTREAGVPLAAMIELANETGAEPWFSIPHQAADATVAAMARQIRDGLAPGRTVYVEHSNEIWNNFPQGRDTEARGTALFGNVATPFERRLNAYGLRSAQICDLFRAEFGAQASRIVCTLGAQAANSFTADQAARCPLAQAAGLRQGNCMQPGDAIAIAPYFGNYTNVENNENEIALWTLDDLFSDVVGDWNLGSNVGSPATGAGELQDPDASSPCTDNFPNTPVDAQGRCPISALEEIDIWLAANNTVRNALGLRLLAYEGGQHLALVNAFSQDQPTQQRKSAIVALFSAANRDPRMDPVYRSYLENWKAKGGELFSIFALSFNYGPFGNWGIVERLNQSPRPPKAAAIDSFNASNPCWYPACTPGTVTPVDPGPDPDASADLSVAVVLDTAAPFESGAPLGFTITLQNAGPDPASGIALNLTAANLSGVTVSGACSSAACTVPNLAAGASASVSVSASIAAAGAFSLSASITDAGQSDPDAIDRSASAGGSASAPPVQGCPAAQLLGDPGLEQGASGPWTFVSAQFGPGLCTLPSCGTDFADPGTAGPRNGSGWAWFGGTSGPNHLEAASLRQTVVFPQDAQLQLGFFLRVGFVSAPFDASLRVMVDGQLVTTVTEPATAQAGFLASSLDVGQVGGTDFADGQPHTISFEYDNAAAGGKSNFNLDDVTLSCVDGG